MNHRDADAPTTSTTPAIVIHGDFTCPWSYLASRRVDVLRGAGIGVEWRAVEHASRRPGVEAAPSVESMREEIEQVTQLLLPGEVLPHGAFGPPPSTRATTTAYAEAHAAGVGPAVRNLLFEEFWDRGTDIGKPAVLRDLLSPILRGPTSPSEVVRDWGHPVDVTGGAISTQAWNLVRRWREEWQEQSRLVPLLRIEDNTTVAGVEAVRWLGQAIVHHDLEPTPPTPVTTALPDPRDQPGLAWVGMNGGQWLARAQRLAASRLRAG